MPGVDLDLTLPSLSEAMATNVARIATALSVIEDDLAALVTAGELNINTALSFQGNPATEVGGVRLTGGVSDVEGTLYVDNNYDLWVTTSAGQVRLTANGALDASSIGGIGGDYGTGNESVAYDSSSQEYRFTADSGVWADLVADDLVLKGSAGSIRLGVDSGLSGTKTLLFKSLPSGIGLLAYRASTQTLEDASALTVDSLTATAITADDYNHTVAFRATVPVVNTAANTNIGMSADDPNLVVSTGPTFWYYTPHLGIIGLREGDRVTNVRVRYSGNSGLTTVNVDVAYYVHDIGAVYTSGSKTTASGHIDVVPASGKNTIGHNGDMCDLMWVRVSGSASGITIEGIDVSWTHPA